MPKSDFYKYKSALGLPDTEDITRIFGIYYRTANNKYTIIDVIVEIYQSGPFSARLIQSSDSSELYLLNFFRDQYRGLNNTLRFGGVTTANLRSNMQ